VPYHGSLSPHRLVSIFLADLLRNNTRTILTKSQVAAYIILGLATIGSEIENPFGLDVNDLPLDTYCRQIAVEMDIMTANPRPDVNDFMSRADNLVLFPLSQLGYPDWQERSVADIRGALRTKVVVNPSSAESDTSTIREKVCTKTTGSV
jgi:putative membrane protein